MITAARRPSRSDARALYRRAWCEMCDSERWFKWDTGHWVCEQCKFVLMRDGAPERAWMGG